MRQRKMPFRANNDISQQYNDGLVQICAVTDVAAPGRQPVEKLSPKYTLRYEERALGINRLYLSRQNHAEIVKVIRIPRVAVTSQDVAITHDGKQYRIDAVQAAKDVFPPSLDLSLKNIEQNLEVMP